MNYDQKEIQMGTQIEREHTQDDKLALKICMDHLREDPKYYSKLNAAGLEQQEEGALSPDEEMGVEECGDSPLISIVSALSGGSDQACVTGQGEQGQQEKLSSTGLGDSGTPKPLKSTNLTAPETKVINNKNTVGTGKTPPLSGATNSESDPMEYFGGQISHLPVVNLPMNEGGAQLKKSR